MWKGAAPALLLAAALLALCGGAQPAATPPHQQLTAAQVGPSGSKPAPCRHPELQSLTLPMHAPAQAQGWALSSHACPDSAVPRGADATAYRTCTFSNLYLRGGRAYYLTDGVLGAGVLWCDGCSGVLGALGCWVLWCALVCLASGGPGGRQQDRLGVSAQLLRCPACRSRRPAGTAGPDLTQLGLRFELWPVSEVASGPLEFMTVISLTEFSRLLAAQGAGGTGTASPPALAAIPTAYFWKGGLGRQPCLGSAYGCTWWWVLG